ncbi:MAG TPA: type IX secretion system membrane protein PorP/SprF [Bacteroidales bacterium]|nr:type IX secretion system membrane protein PorP/SprF [Bacteroidales bacterium]HPJ58093.1 type IX secretion system membrane protein PorP/SprF [Bacteroidales bacterium]HPR12438.1 type IX secretion system membrane protein PorP/SprF [Bacteroidales bacterium]
MRRTAFIISLFLTLINIRVTSQAPDSGRIILGYPVYSQYLHNGLMINPAYAGTRGSLNATLSYRMQWMGIADAPRLQTFSLHTPFKNDKVALGLEARFMQYGISRSSNVYAVYAYHIRFAKSRLSFGLKAGADISNTDYTGLLGVSRPDPVFPEEVVSYVFPNAGAGVYYSSDRIFAGLSVPSFLFYRSSGGSSTQAYHSFSEYDIIFSAGGLITFTPDFKFKPSMLLDLSMHDADKINQLDINGNFIISDLLWVGASWRTTEQVLVAHLQVNIGQQLMIGFSYDYPAGRLTNYSKGSTEFILRYEFGSKVSASNPRYF